MKTNTIQAVTPSSSVFGNVFQEIEEDFSNIRKRSYELFAGNGFADGFDFENWLRAERELFDVPPAELVEEETNFRASVAVPGFTAEQLTVAVTAGSLTIRGNASTKKQGEKKDKQSNVEESHKRMFRHFRLDSAVDPDRVTASFKDGVLTVVLPKVAAAANIPVEPAAQAA